MTRRSPVWIVVVALAAACAVIAGQRSGGAQTAVPVADPNGYDVAVEDDGGIHLPAVDFEREWEHLGTWSLAEADAAGAGELHQVYTQPGVAAWYRSEGEFPDGAVLVKQVLETASADLTTGRASWGTTVAGWFVMVKDRRGRFEGNPLWGDGWGWAWFGAGDLRNTTTKTRQECLGCHVPAKGDDWVYVRGYPALGR